MAARTSAFLLFAVMLAVACADEPASPVADEADPPRPTVAEIVCEADGGTTLLTPEVYVGPGGFELRVRSELEEPASLNGLGMDVEPGVTELVITQPPGPIDVACWPYSDHGSGVEPATQRLTVLDPDGLYVSGELECSDHEQQWGSIIDYVSPVEGSYADPLEAARDYLKDMHPGDELVRAGYPEQEHGPVILVRDGKTIASVSVALADNGKWYIGGAEGCEDVRTDY